MEMDNKNINNLRILAVDMIENAGSGHPGIALGSAPILYGLYSKVLNVTPDDDKNIFRDRFVMSAGHGSSILYATLHAFGYNISMDDLKRFRKKGSITPGHPEYGVVPGVDATTGPLGQGVSTAVGLAIAQRIMASRFNKADITLFDNYTFTLVGEGCLMEGVSYEALSLAGSLGLNKLIVLYDCNKVTLDSDINGVMNQNTLSYMQSLGFNTIDVADGNDVKQIVEAINLAKKSKDKPSFIQIRTHIGFGSALQDSNKSHGSLLGAENVRLLREKLGVNTNPFELDKDVQRDFVFLRKRFETFKKTLKDRIKSYSRAYPGDYKLLQQFISKKFENTETFLNDVTVLKDTSGRDLGNLVLQELCKAYPNIICGSADLSSSTKVKYNDSGFVNDNFANRNIKFGIREFAMGCISNGIALYGGLVPVDSTFMSFSDYMKASLRLRAIMGLKCISVFTHDSIAVGEDGATHEPCEQLNALRDIPNMYTFRPANLTETKASFEIALNSNLPSNIVLSRQPLREFECDLKDVRFGGYILSKEDRGELNAVIIATGSEVTLALECKEMLKCKGYNVRVVSMPCTNLFDKQSEKYKNSIIPPNMKSIFSIEAGATSNWYKYVGKFGKCFGVDDFGGSAKPSELYERFGLTADEMTKEMIAVIKKNRDKILSIV